MNIDINEDMRQYSLCIYNKLMQPFTAFSLSNNTDKLTQEFKHVNKK